MSYGAARAYLGGRWHELGEVRFSLIKSDKEAEGVREAMVRAWCHTFTDLAVSHVVGERAASDADCRFLAALGIRWSE